MIQEIDVDPQKDFQEGIPDLAMSVAEAMITGVVKDTIDTTPVIIASATDIARSGITS